MKNDMATNNYRVWKLLTAVQRSIMYKMMDRAGADLHGNVEKTVRYTVQGMMHDKGAGGYLTEPMQICTNISIIRVLRIEELYPGICVCHWQSRSAEETLLFISSKRTVCYCAIYPIFN